MRDPATATTTVAPAPGGAFVAAPVALAGQLAAIRLRYPDADLAMIADVVRAVIASMAEPPAPPRALSTREASLLTAVEELGRTIAGTKAEIAALRVEEVKDNHIPFATDELDAIVAHTAAATDTILECCETLDALGPTLAEAPAATLQEVTSRVYEACSFQDITGQRITKIVAALKAIEAKVSDISSTFSRGGATVAEAPTPPPTSHLTPPLTPPVTPPLGAAAPGHPMDLLNGPQLPENAMQQSDIDRLLASFD